MPSCSKEEHSSAAKIKAVSVHMITAFGSIIGLLAFAAASREEWRTVFLLMLAAMIIDSVDGTLARKFKVKKTIPWIDGPLMDNLVDFVNYAMLPAFVLLMSPILPDNFRLLGGSMVLVASSFQFTHIDAKTRDHFFRGFPSYWNLVVIYLSLLEVSPGASLAAIITFTFLTFVPVYYVYPSRTPFFKRLTLWLALPWIIMLTGAVLIPGSVSYPVSSDMVAFYSLYYILYYFILSLYLTFRRSGSGPTSNPVQDRV